MQWTSLGHPLLCTNETNLTEMCESHPSQLIRNSMHGHTGNCRCCMGTQHKHALAQLMGPGLVYTAPVSCIIMYSYSQNRSRISSMHDVASDRPSGMLSSNALYIIFIILYVYIAVNDMVDSWLYVQEYRWTCAPAIERGN